MLQDDSPQVVTAEIVNGHVLDVLRSFEAGRFQCVVTSPPYFGLRRYHIEAQTWGADALCDHQWGDEAFAREEAGWNRLQWKTGGTRQGTVPQGETSQGSTCHLCGAWRGELGAEPEPDLYVAHLMQITAEIQRVLRDDGVFWLNLGDSYSGSGKGPETKYLAARDAEGPRTKLSSVPAKSLCLIPERVLIGLQQQGWIVRNKIVWHKKNAMPTSAKDRFKCCWESVYMLVKQQRYKFRLDAVKLPVTASSLRRFDCPSRKPESGSWTSSDAPWVAPGPVGCENGLANPGDVWQITSQPRKENHFAAFPDELVKRCLLASTDPGDQVLDPFVGRGTTCIQAYLMDRDSVGIELNEEYAALAMENLAKAEREKQPRLPMEVKP